MLDDRLLAEDPLIPLDGDLTELGVHELMIVQLAENDACAVPRPRLVLVDVGTAEERVSGENLLLHGGVVEVVRSDDQAPARLGAGKCFLIPAVLEAEIIGTAENPLSLALREAVVDLLGIVPFPCGPGDGDDLAPIHARQDLLLVTRGAEKEKPILVDSIGGERVYERFSSFSPPENRAEDVDQETTCPSWR